MAPFRTLQFPEETLTPDLRAPPPLLAFGADDDLYRVILAERGGARVVEIDRRGGRVRGRVRVDARGTLGPGTGAAGRGGWAVFDPHGADLVAHARGGPYTLPRAGGLADPPAQVLGTALDGEPSVLIAQDTAAQDPTRGARLRVMDAWLGEERVREWFAPPSARKLLAATSTVHGVAAVFSTDRRDEVDVCVSGHGGAAADRTVSLGRGQNFECAAGGGTRIVVVSRGDDRLVVRTLASDLRSELNPVLLYPAKGFSLGAARCAYAGGTFVVAHAEHKPGEHVAVVTVFDAAGSPGVRVPLPSVDAVLLEGKDLTVAAVAGGASAPTLVLQRMLVGGGRHRRYAYPLDEPPARSPEERRALLYDVAHALALSLGAEAPHNLSLRAYDERTDLCSFALPGHDRSRDLTLGLLARADGTGVAAVRVGPGPAPEPRGLNFVERVRQAVTGDDDGDPHTTRLDLSSLPGSIESIVAAVGALRAVQ